jgi:endoribonuclease Dicer
MKEFYHSRKQCSRPRIFALLSQRSHPREYSGSDILRIECAFDGKLLCVADRTEFSTIPDLPSEIVVLYDRPMRSTDTKLFKQLHQLDPAESTFRSYFHAARHALLELGSCASDLVWRRALKDTESRVLSYEEDEEVDSQVGEKLGKGKSGIRGTIKNWVYAMPNLDSSSKGYNVTPKFSRLVQILDSCKPYGETFRGIVFGKLLGLDFRHKCSTA